MRAPKPLPLRYWEALRLLAEPFELMKFTLIYDGELSAKDRGRAAVASNIRNQFHDQLADLWDSHVIFRELARTARTIPNPGAGYYASSAQRIWSPSKLSEYNDPIPPLQEGQTDFCAPIEVPEVGKFIPLVRHSLYLACALDILFLRHEEPLRLLTQGGDLDNRIKTLFDALKMPKEASQQQMPLTADPLYVLLEDDILVSDLSIKTGRLLGARTKKASAVRLTIDVTIKVLRVFNQNQCLVGG